MSGDFDWPLTWDRTVLVHVEFKTEVREVVDYAVVLLVLHDDVYRTVRVYDGVHGVNEMHRYTLSGGKQPADVFHAGTLGEGMRAAMAECARGFYEMIEGWKR